MSVGWLRKLFGGGKAEPEAPSAAVERAPTPLEQRLGWTFRDPAHLEEALTHSTYANENPEAGPHNERLEFVGDAVLGLLTAHLLYDELPDAPEGVLTRRRARVVRGTALTRMASELDLGSALRLGAGPSRAPEGPSESLLANAYEAVAGAVYLDGGWSAIMACYAEPIGAALREATDPVDFKTSLQEACHRRGLLAPEYVVVAVEGPDHARHYTCEVKVDGEVVGHGASTSKKGAEQQCAHEALTGMGEG